ncbi:hypothetical protein ACFSUJ_10405 [Streptomyces lusitanus]|uniref:Lipoprotein n=1 Tax=Streptomyces lusitanus TaxID=68232 RepID=A0ABU3JJH2_9ACTN|nr:hypothetical protein [Streptomyces lusitanus]
MDTQSTSPDLVRGPDHDHSTGGCRPSWGAIAVALVIVIGALSCALLTVVIAPGDPATAATAGVIASSGMTAGAAIICRS